MDQEVLFVTDVARIIGRSEMATRMLIHRGVLKTRRFAGRVVVLRKDFDAMLKNLPPR